MPSDQDPGAREACVVRFIDRYLSGIEYIYATADGTGFLQLDGMHAEAWRERIDELRETYRVGLERLDEVANVQFGAAFKEVSEAHQDQVLEEIGGPAPKQIQPGRREPVGTSLQMHSDDGMGFFDALVLHTRQGFYCDPIYGGNHGRVGWAVVGFPGPETLGDTMNGKYSLEHLLVAGVSWTDLVPHLSEAGSKAGESLRPS